MSDRIPTGAYVIRNKQRSTVLHVENNEADQIWSTVRAYEQDEGQYNNQQIWWIEPLSNYEDSEPEKGVVYSITSPSTGRSLDVSPTHGNTPKLNTLKVALMFGFINILKYEGSEIKASGICVHSHHGEPWQRWRLQKVDDDKGGSYYTITSVFNDWVIDIHSGKPVGSGHELHSQKYHAGYDQHCWELVIPIVGFPPGWFQIENAGTGGLLSHNYVYNLPVLLPPPESPRPSQDHEHWGFQWTLTHAKFYKSEPTAGRNSWCIVNRLTRRRLSSLSARPTCETLRSYDRSLTWKLELDSSCNWKIINLETSCILEQATIARGGGTAVICEDQKFTLEGGRKSWILRPPVLEAIDSVSVSVQVKLE